MVSNVDLSIAALHVNVNDFSCQEADLLDIFSTKPRRDVHALKEQWQRDSQTVIQKLVNVASEHHLEKAKYAADRITLCCDSANFWINENYPDGKGGTFPAIGTNIQCYNIFCSACAGTGLRTRKSKAKARAAFKFINRNKAALEREHIAEHYAGQPDPKLRFAWQFLTLTTPTLLMLGVPLVTQLRIVNNAFRRLQRRACWFKRVIGSYRTLEFKPGNRVACDAENREWDYERDGLNIHLNGLLYGAKLDREACGSVWAECITAACKEFDVDLGSNAPESLRLNASDISPFYDPRKPTTLNTALEKVLNYMSKPQPWGALPETEMLQVLKTAKLPDMFGRTGRMINATLEEHSQSVQVSPQTDGSQVVSDKPKRVRRTPTIALTAEQREAVFHATAPFKQAYRREQRLVNNPYAEFQDGAGEIYSAADSQDDYMRALAAGGPTKDKRNVN